MRMFDPVRDDGSMVRTKAGNGLALPLRHTLDRRNILRRD
jgi:hypothetical protein